MWKAKREGHIYFIEAMGLNIVKFGFTTQTIQRRMRQLHGQSPVKVPLKCLAYVKGTKELHEKLKLMHAQDCVHDEWYRKTKAVLATKDAVLRAKDPEEWAEENVVYYPITPPPNNGASCVVVPVSVDGTARQRPVPGTSIPSLAVLKENIR